MTHLDTLFMEASERRLVDLIRTRLEPYADTEAIDARIWDLFGEDWCVMFTDLSGFSRHSAEFGIIHFVQVIIESERLFAPILEAHGAFIVKREGDSLLILFRDPVRALACGEAMQAATVVYNQDKAAENHVILSLGLSYGRILRIGATDVFGNAVNAASKLGEDTAGPGEILVSEDFRAACADACAGRLEPIDFVPPGSSAAYRLDRRKNPAAKRASDG
jgi:adenylate cyclase